MASSLKLLLSYFFFFISIFSLSNAKPITLTLPVTKHASNQYLTTIKQRTPLISVNLVVDLGGHGLWVDCEHSYVSSSYTPAHCDSTPCTLAKSIACGDCYPSSNKSYAGPIPGCNNHTCGMFPENTVTRSATPGELAMDVLSLDSTKGAQVSIPRFVFTCGYSSLLEGLAGGVKGMAGLGRAGIGMPSLLASALSLQTKFSVCLPSSASRNGAILFGDVNISTPLTHTKLIINLGSTAGVYTQGEPSHEYFVTVKSIWVNQKRISVNPSLLSINKEGYGGTKLSSVNPYTELETSIYTELTRSFVREAKLRRVASVAPFGFCFDSAIGKNSSVPHIDLVFQSRRVYWRISAANSMVNVRKGVMCLGFVDGGLSPKTSIVVGGHQLEENLMQFDLATSMLGFRKTSCSNLNFIAGPPAIGQ